ncbi:MAG: hypothetical protein AAGE92_15235 [Cyanobacteria bacterium P01_G01_bin.4]
MTFDWANQKDAWQGKLKVVGLGQPAGNAPGSEQIESLGVTLQLIDVMGQSGAVQDRDLPSECTVSVKSEGDDNAYVLPWKASSATITSLGGSHEVFVTSQLNGCAIFIGGDSGTPTVIHANAQPEDYTNAGEPESFDQIREFAVNTRLPRWDSYYGAVAQKLATTGHLPTTNAGTLLPGDYMKNGDAAVFGVKDGGSWEFFVNSGNSTTKFWPAAA